VADASGSSAFYLRLAPLLGAYSFIVQAGQMGESAARQALLDQAVAGLEGISRQGTYPPRVVAVYRRHLPGAPQGITAMDDAGLRAEVAAEMAAGRYEQAIPLLNALLSRRPLSAEAGSDRFNLAVCNYHTGRLSAAVDQFLEIATRRAGTGSKPAGAGDVPDLAGRAIEYAYQCALQLARVSRARKDYALLARCATLLVEKLPNHPRADEARWAAALALQEAQDDAAAVSAFAAVPRTSGRYWAARRNEAACLQRIYENLPPDAPPQDRPVAARRALEAWMSVARDAAARSTSKGTTMPASPPAPDAINLVELAGMSTLAAASLLAGSDIAEYARALDVIDPLPASGRVLALRIRCLRGLGDASAARHALAEFLSRSAQEETGAVLGGLLAETEAQIDRLRVLGRRQEAARAASDMVPLLETLLAWVEGSPRHASHAGVVRASLANALHEAGRIEEAVTQLDAAQAAGPADLRVLHLAAVWAEETARQAGDRQKASAPPPAQARWGRLLEVPGIRETAPKVYWEARYHWLRYALDAGKAADVLNAIDSEKAWFPDLGGPPWQARLLELADQARAALAAGDTPSQPQKDPAGSGEPRR
jgi:tetratricopeptide (TPR) repeat protein